MTHYTPLNTLRFVSITAAATGLIACSNAPQTGAADTAEHQKITQTISSPDGQSLGSLMLEDLGPDGTKITVSVTDISPGPHAMHFHQTGKCEAPDFKSAGGHYNPTQADHGHKMTGGPHAGDMMNVIVDADGTGSFIVTNERVSIKGHHGLPALLDSDGTALILHAGPDDYESQPSGAAGARIGCAVIAQ